PPCRQSVAKLQPVRNQHPNAQMLSQRAHYVVEALAYQHYFLSVRLRFLQFVDAPLLQRGFQQILKILLLGEEYFQYLLKPTLKQRGVDELKKAQANGKEVVLVSQGLDHVMRPLAQHLGVGMLVSNRLEFRDGLATGRLLDPVIRPRGPLARLI